MEVTVHLDGNPAVREEGFFTLSALLVNTNIDQIVSDSIAGIGAGV